MWSETILFLFDQTLTDGRKLPETVKTCLKRQPCEQLTCAEFLRQTVIVRHRQKLSNTTWVHRGPTPNPYASLYTTQRCFGMSEFCLTMIAVRSGSNVHTIPCIRARTQSAKRPENTCTATIYVNMMLSLCSTPVHIRPCLNRKRKCHTNMLTRVLFKYFLFVLKLLNDAEGHCSLPIFCLSS